MSCMVQQSPSKNKPHGIYGNEGFKSLKGQENRNPHTWYAAQNNNWTAMNTCMHTYTNTHTHGTVFMHRFTAQRQLAPHEHTHKRWCARRLLLHTYTSCGESNHWEENDAEFSLRHLGADGGEHCHHGTWLETDAPRMWVMKNIFFFAWMILRKLLQLLKMGRGVRWLFCTCS